MVSSGETSVNHVNNSGSLKAALLGRQGDCAGKETEVWGDEVTRYTARQRLSVE